MTATLQPAMIQVPKQPRGLTKARVILSDSLTAATHPVLCQCAPCMRVMYRKWEHAATDQEGSNAR
jgi:hypothetical protein